MLDRGEGFLRGLTAPPRRRAGSAPGEADPAEELHSAADQPLCWVKVSDPDAPLPYPQDGVDLRVLLPDLPAFDAARERLTGDGIPFREVGYWLESEVITSFAADGSDGPLMVYPALTATAGGAAQRPAARAGVDAIAARDAFEMIWQAQDGVTLESGAGVPAGDLLPAGWLPYLPYPTLNPAQAEAAPHVASGGEHAVVVAPTGAGKTVIGMMAALRTVLGEGRKAAWLVPQRSLTDELDRELEVWRRRGLRVERLSGEYAVDAQRVRDADLWVATTEKFESICRTWSMREALAEVGCLVVDEIHLLGDAVRGPVLEALLARVHGGDAPVRIVGLSATIANAAEIAGWLGARLVATSWRPSRLTWQLPMITATSDRVATQAARTRVAVAITQMVTAEGGSVLVFCGSKRNVRAAALAIAEARGAQARHLNPDDLDRVHDVCADAGVGLHYKDWEYKREAEQAFRERRFDVLVATTTVAAGVNLPARAVIVRDTQVGLNQLDVALVQQMFGRAGRIGAGETDGWAYLIADENERPLWQARLVAGYRAASRIADSLADHLLAETVQGRAATLREAEAWWVRTLAYYQGSHSLDRLHRAIGFLAEGGYLTSTPQPDGDADLAATELGAATTKLMVPTSVGHHLRTTLLAVPVPTGPQSAERSLIAALAVLVPGLAEAPVPEELRPAVARLLQAGGHLGKLGAAADPARGEPPSPGSHAPGDLAKACLLAAANSPRAFVGTVRHVAGIPYGSMYPILEEAPHYLHWIGAQGYLGTIPPWAAVVAADLSRRIRWRRLAPGRGSGRLLWMCEQMATPLRAEAAVPAMWKAATAQGLTAPDWPPGRRPSHCTLDAAAYTTLLRDRLTGSTLAADSGHVAATVSTGATALTWTGPGYVTQTLDPGEHQLSCPPLAPGDPPDTDRGAALFGRRGDYLATGWLAAYRHT